MSASERRETYITRRDALKYLAAGTAAVVVAAVGGKIYGEGETRGQFLKDGDISPELRAKLESAGFRVYEPPEGLTVANMRGAGLDIAPFPSPEGTDIEEIPSSRWFAINPDEFYIPGKGDEDVRGLKSLVSGKTSAVRRIDSNLQFVAASPVDLLWADYTHRLETGEGLITSGGFIVTGAKFENTGVGLGRRSAGEPLSYTTFDASTQNPVPPQDKLVAAGIVVAASARR